MKFRISIFLLTLVAMLPLGVLYLISDFFAFVLHCVIRYRRRIVRQNLVASFPEKSLAEIKEIEKRYYRFVSDVMVET
ncbi:MAG: acetyltransferase, partial [Muribaculaceae bacterium]|nr:acetyltransferase [Muribaculaceae bacterium]